MALIKLDQVAGYALVLQPQVIKLDQVAAYALVGLKMVNQYKVDAKQQIADSINSEHRLSLRVDDFDLGVPSIETAGRFNAKISISVKPSSGFSGSMDLLYARAPIEDIVVGRDLDLFRYNGEAVTTHEYLDVFNSIYGTKLTASDIVDEPIPTDTSTKFKATPDSLFFDPGTEVDVGILCPSARDFELKDKGLQWPDMNAMLVGAISNIDIGPTRTMRYPFTEANNAFNGRFSSGTLSNTSNTYSLAEFLNGFFTDNPFTSNMSFTQERGFIGAPFETVALPDPRFPEALPGFNIAVVLKPTATSWYKSNIILHLNR